MADAKDLGIKIMEGINTSEASGVIFVCFSRLCDEVQFFSPIREDHEEQEKDQRLLLIEKIFSATDEKPFILKEQQSDALFDF